MVKSLLSLDKKTGLTPVEISSIATDNVAKKDSGRPGRIGLWALILGFGGFLAWSALAPLDEGVPAPGTVAIDTKRKAVQHLQVGMAGPQQHQMPLDGGRRVCRNSASGIGRLGLGFSRCHGDSVMSPT